MNDFEKGQKAIKTIKKYGDLYDAIARSSNNQTSAHPFGRFHLFAFSRILYGGLIISENIGSLLAPVKKVKEAQDEIRALLGVNVDIIRAKGATSTVVGLAFPDHKSISLLYDDDHAFMDEYIANLQKISSFCIMHHINTIYLNLDDLGRLFINLNLNPYTACSLSYILNKAELSDLGENNESYLVLKQNELQKLINQLLYYKLDKNFIMRIGHLIDDPAVEMALASLDRYGTLNDFKNVLLSRLCLNINSDSGYKTKDGHKATDNVSISGEYIKVVSTIEESSEPPKTTVMLLCEYLGYPNYEALLNSLKHLDDDKDRVLMAILHLYINNREKVILGSSSKNSSLYDRLYEEYIAHKKDHKVRTSYRYPKKTVKLMTNLISMMMALYLTGVAFAAGIVSLYGIELLQRTLLNKEDPNIVKSFVDLVIMPYKYSWNIEKEIIQDITGELTSTMPELSDGITHTRAGGLFGLDFGGGDERVIANVFPLEDEAYYDLPEYYAVGYGASSTYHKGDITYDLKEQTVDYAKMQPLENLFKVETYFSKKEIRNMIKDNTITIPMALYPMDTNYILTKVVIYDEDDSEKKVILDAYRTNIYNGYISDHEVEVLRSMKYPAIEFYYGINYLYYNSFVRNIEKNGPYLETDEKEMCEVITKALGLPPDASYEEIYDAIKSKKYSLDPFGDSDIKANTKKMDEKEFMGTIASMDYLICNLAATLAVEANQDLTYVVGFMSDNETITYGEAHAWAVSPFGTIVEVTPTDIDEEEENTVISDILDWAMQNKIPVILALALIGGMTYKLFGKRMIFNIKVHNLNHLLHSSQMPEAYSYINEARFGGINLSKEHMPLEYLKMLENDFEGYTKEELQELLKMLKNGQNEAKPLAIKVVKRVPFIKQNEYEIARKLRQKRK